MSRWRSWTSPVSSTHEASPGWVAFQRDGQPWRLRSLDGGDGELWLIFGDATNGSETYGGGRFLYTEPLPTTARWSIDFNRAYNPPCVFSPYATCPLPVAGEPAADAHRGRGELPGLPTAG